MWYNIPMPAQPKNVRVSEVKPDVQYGLYMWRLPDGKLFTDDDGNYLNIPAMYGEISKIAELREAAAYYGQPEGTPYWKAGLQRATEEEYSEQVDRLKEGYIPSLNDVGAVMDAKRSAARRGGDE